ncbi:MAG: aminopeptidase [Brevefilum sp.]
MNFDNNLIAGARNAVSVCMGVQEDDKVLIFTDKKTEAIGNALAQAVQEAAAELEIYYLEDIDERPLNAVPQTLWNFLDNYRPTVTFYAASSQEGEILFRIPLLETLREKYQVRHGHMIGITPELMQTGMLADYNEVSKRSHQVYDLVKNARSIKVTSPFGTNLTAQFDPDQLKWVNWDGLYHKQGIWGNLPEGEVFTSPVSVDGILSPVVLGDFFSHKYGLLDEPLMLEVENSLLKSAIHKNEALVKDFMTYLSGYENGTRIGEFAIGTNEYLTEFVGNLLQDEKFPGVHVAFGNPYANYTGARWDCAVHVDVVMEKVSIWVDDFLIMKDGAFTI